MNLVGVGGCWGNGEMGGGGEGGGGGKKFLVAKVLRDSNDT